MSSQPQLNDLYSNQDEASSRSLESPSPGLSGFSLTWTAQTLASTSSHELQQCPTAGTSPSPTVSISPAQHMGAGPAAVQGSADSRVGWAGHSPALCSCEMGLWASPTASPTADIHPPFRGTASWPEKASFSKLDREQGIRVTASLMLKKSSPPLTEPCQLNNSTQCHTRIACLCF